MKFSRIKMAKFKSNMLKQFITNTTMLSVRVKPNVHNIAQRSIMVLRASIRNRNGEME